VSYENYVQLNTDSFKLQFFVVSILNKVSRRETVSEIKRVEKNINILMELILH
jgi:hypothetical protein